MSMPPTAAVKRMRQEAAQFYGLAAWRASPGMVWAMTRQGLDPAARLRWVGLQRWAREWWYQTIPERPEDLVGPKTLNAAFRKAVVPKVSRSRNMTNPAEIAIESAKEAGWCFKNANTIIARKGEVISLMDAAPKLVETLFYRDFQEEQGNKAFKEQYHRNGNNEQDKDKEKESRDWLTIRQVLHAKGKNQLQPGQKRALRKFVGNNVVTQAVLHKWGLVESPMCLFCAVCVDDADHRIFGNCCEEAREGVCNLANVLQGCGDDDLKGGRKQGLFPALGNGGDEASFDVIAEESGEPVEYCEPFFLSDDGIIAVDGSCIAPHMSWNRASGAIVQVDKASGRVTKSITFRVPADYPQSAAAGEQFALYWADRTAEMGATVISDCKAAIAGYMDREAGQHDERRSWAGLWRQYKGTITNLEKVKAHTELCDDAGADESHRWWLNHHADRLANDRAKAALPQPGRLSLMEETIRARKKFLRGVATILAGWPVQELPKKHKKSHVGELVLYHPHVIGRCRMQARWMCLRCRRSCQADNRAHFEKEPCPEGGKDLDEATADRLRRARSFGHDPWVGMDDSGVVVLSCVACGSYMTTQERGMSKMCPKTCSSGALVRRNNFLAGKHPTMKTPLAVRPGRAVLPLDTQGGGKGSSDARTSRASVPDWDSSQADLIQEWEEE